MNGQPIKIREDSNTQVVQTLRIEANQQRDPHRLKELTLAQLQRLVDDFDLGRIIRMEEALTTQCNITDPFRTGQGVFMIRIRHGEEFGERVEFIHAIMQHLRAQGLPVPEVMKRPNGRSWSTWGERIVEIHRYIPHDEGLHRDWQRMYSAAAAMGDLHSGLYNFSSSVPPVPPEMRNDLLPSECWNLLPHAESNLYDAIKEESPATDAAKQVLSRTRDLLVPLLDNYERMLGNLPWKFVHGDYHFWNLLYRSDDVVGIVDFDFVQERERIFDVAYAVQAIIGYMNYNEGGSQERFPIMSWNNLRLWLDTYDDVVSQPLTEFERRLLPREILRIFLVNAVVGATQPTPVETLQQSARDIDLYEWLYRQEDFFLS